MERTGKLVKVAGIVLVLSLVLFSIHCTRCSSREKRDTGAITPVKKPPPSPVPVIVEVQLDPPQPTSADFIRAMPVLENTGMTHVKYTYHWYVNGSRVPGDNKRLLARQSYKRGDKVYCRVSASRGIHEARPLNSKRVTIQNARPFFRLSAVTPFKIPGRFRYTLKAEDPDGDPLTYRLLAPLGLGITLDPETGEITWDINEIPQREPAVDRGQTGGSADEEGAAGQNPERIPEQPQTAQPRITPTVRLIFEAADPDGAAARGSIRLYLSKEGVGKEIPG